MNLSVAYLFRRDFFSNHPKFYPGVALIIILLLLFTNCSKDEHQSQSDIPLNSKSTTLVKASNDFGIDLFKKVYATPEKKPNFMISPLSVSLALGMTYNGADGSTKTAMEETLKLSGLTCEEINEAYKKIVEALLLSDPKVVFEVANSIWYRNTFHVEQPFIDRNKSFYNAEVFPSNFADPETVGVLNGWVSDKTHEKIKTIIDEIDPSTVMFLVNAIYFNGTWQTEFNTKSTMKYPFKTDSDDYEKIDMMQRLDTVEYFENELLSAVKLPYGNGNFNMVVLLPYYQKTVADVVNAITPSNWAQWNNSFSIVKGVDIKLPKFKIEYETFLDSPLKAMGMSVAYNPSLANFTGINRDGGLYISFVKHKTFVSVDEKGTEAAAVTIVAIDKTSFDPNEPRITPFIVDRPFLFAITEKNTGAILFIGKFGKP